jgi:S-formylglutathione hydrolase FrmB
VVAGNGEDDKSAGTTLGLDTYVAKDEAIIVTPVETAGIHNNLMTDWADGSSALDQDFATKLVPLIDARYRTLADRAHRVIAGYSAGGYSSMSVAAHHPDLFAAAAAFSGAVDITDRGAVGEAELELIQDVLVDNNPSELFKRFGDPYTDPLSWEERNPNDLAMNLRGMDLFLSAGNAVPADLSEVADDGPGLVPQVQAEEELGSMTRTFVATLNADHIPVTYHPRKGTHNAMYWRQDLALWWPQMLKALGARPPKTFDYRSAAPRFGVWGWTFTATRPTAREFLDVTDAGPNGVTLHGSGTVHVCTRALARPGTRVALGGASAPAATANRQGRICFRAPATSSVRIG